MINKCRTSERKRCTCPKEQLLISVEPARERGKGGGGGGTCLKEQLLISVEPAIERGKGGALV